jgi:hypothetical protein
MKIFLTILTALITTSAMAQNMQKYLSDTEDMVKEKKYQEANERFVWFQDSSLHYEKAMTGVRLSFALSAWKDLAEIYSPALESMKSMRDHKTKLLVDSNASPKLFTDVVSLNRELSEDEKTIALFEIINNTDIDKAKTCFISAKEILFKKKKYDIIKDFIGNPVNEFKAIKTQRNSMLKPLNDKKKYESLLSHINTHFVERCLALIKFSVAVDDMNAAKKIKEEAQLIVKDNRLRDIKLVKE